MIQTANTAITYNPFYELQLPPKLRAGHSPQHKANLPATLRYGLRNTYLPAHLHQASITVQQARLLETYAASSINGSKQRPAGLLPDDSPTTLLRLTTLPRDLTLLTPPQTESTNRRPLICNHPISHACTAFRSIRAQPPIKEPFPPAQEANPTHHQPISPTLARPHPTRPLRRSQASLYATALHSRSHRIPKRSLSESGSDQSPPQTPPYEQQAYLSLLQLLMRSCLDIPPQTTQAPSRPYATQSVARLLTISQATSSQDHPEPGCITPPILITLPSPSMNRDNIWRIGFLCRTVRLLNHQPALHGIPDIAQPPRPPPPRCAHLPLPHTRAHAAPLSDLSSRLLTLPEAHSCFTSPPPPEKPNPFHPGSSSRGKHRTVTRLVSPSRPDYTFQQIDARAISHSLNESSLSQVTSLNTPTFATTDQNLSRIAELCWTSDFELNAPIPTSPDSQRGGVRLRTALDTHSHAYRSSCTSLTPHPPSAPLSASVAYRNPLRRTDPSTDQPPNPPPNNDDIQARHSISAPAGAHFSPSLCYPTLLHKSLLYKPYTTVAPALGARERAPPTAAYLPLLPHSKLPRGDTSAHIRGCPTVDAPLEHRATRAPVSARTQLRLFTGLPQTARAQAPHDPTPGRRNWSVRL
ncbi:hypothetical protein BT96DRAFT_996047 [Gymnopus androsaceus JB14]|uniref:Uncharacterized protein n=1 Tax=Gymnopus androsaceus JB14 TaxID=1447944 RepID=A0A6A4HI62_9AGAR|nr:hypothetical protein BT96DRAFT_996047 [Gymnopus androsaceus JB14]